LNTEGATNKASQLFNATEVTPEQNFIFEFKKLLKYEKKKESQKYIFLGLKNVFYLPFQSCSL
jgi:hypothetical protein